MTGGGKLQVAGHLYSMSVMNEHNGVLERKQCFSCKCHVFNIYSYKFLHSSGTRAFTINFTTSPIIS